MSLVFQNIDPPPPSPPASVSSPPTKAGVHTRRAERGGGGSIFWKTRETGLPCYSNNLSTRTLGKSTEPLGARKNDSHA
jgi:hypothetical protein